jgi:hypothetical protein
VVKGIAEGNFKPKTGYHCTYCAFCGLCPAQEKVVPNISAANSGSKRAGKSAGWKSFLQTRLLQIHLCKRRIFKTNRSGILANKKSGDARGVPFLTSTTS